MILDCTTKAVSWKAFIGSIARVNDEVSFNVKTDMISTKEIMTSGVALSVLEWSKDKFSKFECTNEKRIGIRINDVEAVLKRFKNDEEIHVSVDNNGNMHITNSTKEYELSTTSPSEPYSKSGKLNDQIDYVKFESNSNELESMIKDISLFGDALTISSKIGRIEFTAKEEYGTNKGKVILKKDYIDKEASTTLNIEFVQEILNELGGYSEKIDVYFFDNGYLMLRFFINNLGDVDYFISPRLSKSD